MALALFLQTGCASRNPTTPQPASFPAMVDAGASHPAFKLTWQPAYPGNTNLFTVIVGSDDLSFSNRWIIYAGPGSNCYCPMNLPLEFFRGKTDYATNYQ